MRQNPNSRRSRGRGGRKPGNPRNQIFDSNGPGARVRGNSSQIYEKYQQLARDAASSGDRVGAENFYQHAEHYYRLMEAAGLNRKENSQNESQQAADTPAPNGQAVEQAAGSGSAQAEVIDAAAESNSDTQQAPAEKANGSAEGEEQPKPARRSRSRRSNGAANGGDSTRGEEQESSSDADGETPGEDTEPATA